MCRFSRASSPAGVPVSSWIARLLTVRHSCFSRSADGAIRWLWTVHNRVNRRLASDITADPEHPKIQFPAPGMCEECCSSHRGVCVCVFVCVCWSSHRGERACVRACVCVCVGAHTEVSVRACVRVCVCAELPQRCVCVGVPSG